MLVFFAAAGKAVVIVVVIINDENTFRPHGNLGGGMDKEGGENREKNQIFVACQNSKYHAVHGHICPIAPCAC